MGKVIYRLLLSVTGLLCTTIAFAQEITDSVRHTITANNIDNAMRSNEKIYVVMAVCITILVVLFVYLIRIDRKVSELEKHP